MELPGHRIDSLIREVAGSRLVVRSFTRGRNCVTRVLLSDRVDPRLGTEIERIVLTGEGFAPLPRSLDLTLAGYRVAARLPREPNMPWTSAVAAGVNADGYLYVSTRWMEGTPMHHLMGQLSERMRRQVVQEVARILVELHARSIAYGDFKADNLVMSPSGQIVLIDLDTLRLVPGPTMPAVTQDVTRSWAAPEQFQQQTYLSSDIYAFGRLIGELFPEDLPLEWQELVAACRLTDPLQRPQTSLVYQRLRGQRVVLRDWNDRPTPPPMPVHGSVTERVPESDTATPPVPTETPIFAEVEDSPAGSVNDTADVPPPVPTLAGPTAVPQAPPDVKPVRKRTGLTSCLLFALVPLAFSVVLCAGAGLWYQQRQVDEANSKAESTLAAMKIYKTVPEVNRDTTQRKHLRQLADDAYLSAHTPRTAAVRALALVWEQGWQDTNKSWNTVQFSAANDAIHAVPSPPPIEAQLAEATLYSGSCRLNSNTEEAGSDCVHSLAVLNDFFHQLPDSDENNWMKVEAYWVKVLVLSQQYARTSLVGSGEAGSLLAQARQVCTDAETILAYAPVNGPELLEDCLVLDGKAQDINRYFATATLLSSLSSDSTTQRHLFLAAGPGCENLSFKKGSKVEPVPKSDPWCVAMGWAAQQQWLLAASAAKTHLDDGRPWPALMERLQQEVPQAFVISHPFWDLPVGGE